MDSQPGSPGGSAESPVPSHAEFGDEPEGEQPVQGYLIGEDVAEEPAERQLPVPASMAHSVDRAVFSRATMITISEVGFYVKKIMENSNVQEGGLPPDLQQVHEYCRVFAPRKSEPAEQQCRVTATRAITADYLAGLVLNLAPETAEEVVALIPQLAPGPDSMFSSEDKIEEMVNELEQHKMADTGA